MKKKVLVADGEPPVCQELSRKLLAQDYEVLLAAGGQDALRRFDMRQVDLLLIDLDVPEPEGWGVLPQIAELNPCLLVMGLTERSDLRALAVSSGLSAVAEKPIDVRALLAVVQELFTQVPAGPGGFRYVPGRALAFREKLSHRISKWSLCPAAYSGWGINE
ncbi:MAG: response regulator [Limisphaerales bacterium]